MSFKLALDGLFIGTLGGFMLATIIQQDIVALAIGSGLWGMFAGLVWEFLWLRMFGDLN